MKKSISSVHLAWLILGCLGLWGWTYGMWDLTGVDECRYVQVAREMIARGDWFSLTVYGQPYDQKPPLPFWMLALAIKLNGGEVSPWAARLPSIMFSIATVLLTYCIGCRLFNRRTGLLSAVVLLTSPLLATEAPTARLDMIFTGWITAVMWIWISRNPDRRFSVGRAILFWGCLAGAFFTKGPLALVIVIGTILAECAFARSWKSFGAIRPLWGGLMLVGAMAAWFWSEYQEAGPSFLYGQIIGETIGRLLESQHGEPFWYYLKSIFSTLFLPWSLFLIPAAIYLWKARRKQTFTRLRPILIWIILPLAILHLSINKRSFYLLPLVPAFSVVVGWYLSARFLKMRLPAKWKAAFSGATIVLCLAVLAGALWICIRPKWFWTYDVQFNDFQQVMSFLLLLVLIGITIQFIRQSTTRALVRAASVFMFIGLAAYLGIVRPAINERKSGLVFSRTVESLLEDPGDEVIVFGKASKEFYHVYGSYRVLPMDDDDKILPTGENNPKVFLVRAKDEDEIGSATWLADFTRLYQTESVSTDLVVYRRKKKIEPEQNRPYTFALVGDTGTGGRHVRRLAEQMDRVDSQNPLDGVFLLGDNFYGDEPFDLAFRDDFVNPFGPLVHKGIPFYAALGNHDYAFPDIYQNHIQQPIFNMAGREYYLETFGKDLVTFFVLNSETFADDPEQIAWFKLELARCKSVWKILILHKPLVASEIQHGGSSELYRLIKSCETEQVDIDVVFSGHNHVYERRKIVDRIQHITIGGGGKLTKTPFPSDPERAVGFNRAHAFGWMTIRDNQLYFQAVDEWGELVDQAVLTDIEEPTADIQVSLPKTTDRYLPKLFSKNNHPISRFLNL